MKEFDVTTMPENLQALIKEIPYIMDALENDGGAPFKVKTAPDPEWGNMHVPLAQWLVRNGARSGEEVYLKGIEAPLD